MRELVVSEAPLSTVAAHVRDVVEDQGGVIASHTHRATEFDHLRTQDDDWSRSGYIGTYQPFKQDQIRIRIRVWASWPRRLLFFFLYLGFAEAILFFGMSLAQVPPPPNVWIVTAILTFLAIGISLLTYSTSWAASSEVEDTLARHIGSEIRDDETVEGPVYTLGAWEEHRRDLVDEAVKEAKAQGPRTQTTEGTVASGGLLARVKRRTGLGGSEDEAEEPEPDEEPAQADQVPGDDPPGDEDREKRSLRDRLPFFGTKDQADEPVAPEAGPDEAEETDEARSSGGLRSKIPFLGAKTKGAEGEEEEDKGSPQDAPDEPASEDEQAKSEGS